MKKVIVVTGATGNQGGAVIRHLLNTNFEIKAVSRNLNSSTAQKLRDMGVVVVQGDLDKPETLPPILAGAYGVFSVQNNWTSSVENEIAQGKALADAAKAANIQHIVYSSVGGAERATAIPHFDSKFEIEQYIIKLGLAYTFVRPAYFISNLLGTGKMSFMSWGLLSWALKGGKTLQMVDVDDIGGFAAHCFVNDKKYIGKSIELAGDELTYAQIKSIFVKDRRKIPFYVTLPAWLLKPINLEVYTMFKWFKESGYEADIQMLKVIYPPLKTLKQSLQNVPV